IAIKVDREERPDVDAVYLAAVRELGVSGGWPLNVVVTPSREVVWGGTYFSTRRFLASLRVLGERFACAPRQGGTHQPAVTPGRAVTRALRARETAPDASPGVPGEATLQQAARFYAEAFDAEHGGLRGAPKFPATFATRFLLRYARRFPRPAVLPLVVQTLE